MMTQSLSVRHEISPGQEANSEFFDTRNHYQDALNGSVRTLTLPLKDVPTQPFVLVFTVPSAGSSHLTPPVLEESLDDEAEDWDFRLQPPVKDTKQIRAFLQFAGRAKPRPIDDCDD